MGNFPPYKQRKEKQRNREKEKSDFRKLFTLQSIIILTGLCDNAIHAAEEKVTYLHETRKVHSNISTDI